VCTDPTGAPRSVRDVDPHVPPGYSVVPTHADRGDMKLILATLLVTLVIGFDCDGPRSPSWGSRCS